MSYATDRREFIAVLREEFPNRPRSIVEAFARHLMRRASTSNRIACILCSIDVGPKEQARLEKEDEKNDQAIVDLCKPWGIKVITSGDPRGYTIKLLLPSGRYNTWGGKESGFGVPAREPNLNYG